MRKKLTISSIIILILFAIIWLYNHHVIENNADDNELEDISKYDDKIPENLRDNGIFTQFYNLAYEKLNNMSLDEKIGQIFLVRYPQENAMRIIKDYSFGGFIFFEKDFEGKTKDQVVEMISSVQDISKVPLITAVDEEG